MVVMSLNENCSSEVDSCLSKTCLSKNCSMLKLYLFKLNTLKANHHTSSTKHSKENIEIKLKRIRLKSEN